MYNNDVPDPETENTDELKEPEEESVESLVAELAADPEEDVPEQVGDLDTWLDVAGPHPVVDDVGSPFLFRTLLLPLLLLLLLHLPGVHGHPRPTAPLHLANLNIITVFSIGSYPPPSGPRRTSGTSRRARSPREAPWRGSPHSSHLGAQE